MFFMLRVAFWLTIVLALLPTGGSQPQASGNTQFNTVEAMSAAGAAVGDVSGFCDRQPDACKVGAQAAVVIGQRAQAGASMVYDFIQDRVTRYEPASTVETKAVPASMTRTVPSQPGSQSTLKPSDLDPAWHGSLPRRETVPLPRPRTKQSV